MELFNDLKISKASFIKGRAVGNISESEKSDFYSRRSSDECTDGDDGNSDWNINEENLEMMNGYDDDVVPETPILEMAAQGVKVTNDNNQVGVEKSTGVLDLNIEGGPKHIMDHERVGLKEDERVGFETKSNEDSGRTKIGGQIKGSQQVLQTATPQREMSHGLRDVLNTEENVWPGDKVYHKGQSSGMENLKRRIKRTQMWKNRIHDQMI